MCDAQMIDLGQVSHGMMLVMGKQFFQLEVDLRIERLTCSSSLNTWMGGYESDFSSRRYFDTVHTGWDVLAGVV
jgi:hypothetical protein